jgi:hypothetical protein
MVNKRQYITRGTTVYQQPSLLAWQTLWQSDIFYLQYLVGIANALASDIFDFYTTTLVLESL